MCEPITSDMERRKHSVPPPNGKDKRMQVKTTADVWRQLVDWGVRLLLFAIAFFLYGQRAQLDRLHEDIEDQGEVITEVRIELAAALQEDVEQGTDIETNLQTNIALMTLLNEVTANVATLTERVNQTTLRLDRMELQ